MIRPKGRPENPQAACENPRRRKVPDQLGPSTGASVSRLLGRARRPPPAEDPLALPSTAPRTQAGVVPDGCQIKDRASDQPRLAEHEGLRQRRTLWPCPQRLLARRQEWYLTVARWGRWRLRGRGCHRRGRWGRRGCPAVRCRRGRRGRGFRRFRRSWWGRWRLRGRGCHRRGRWGRRGCPAVRCRRGRRGLAAR